MVHHKIFIFLLSICIYFFAAALCGAPAYEISFEGVEESFKGPFTEYSSLIKYQDEHLKTSSQLDWRTEDDLNLLKRLYQEKGYLSPALSYTIQQTTTVPHIILMASAGELYRLTKVEVSVGDTTYEINGEESGQTATLDRLLRIEEKLIRKLQKGGYPFAILNNRTITADREQKEVSILLEVTLGPKALFAGTTIEGNNAVDIGLIQQKIGWDEGDAYSAAAIEETIAALEATGLFTHISVRPLCTDADEVPMIIEVAEAKHRTIAAGVGFTSQLGPGINLEWENRNFRGLGETLNFKTSLWSRLQGASVLYLKPNVFIEGQNLISKGEILREVTDGFTASSWGVSSVLERQLSEKTQVSYGLAFKQIHDTRSDNNRHFTLLKTPLKVYYNKTNDLMDPTKGRTVLVKFTPTLQLLSPQFAYCITQVNATQYVPLTKQCVLAGKLSVGSIWGASRKGIPPSERFYAGTESLLRGYRYMSVSPLNHRHKPIGGRSLLVGSIELRTKITENIGLVGFYEAGNVFTDPFPNFKEKILQSTGLGIRYHTPVGPLRCDVGIPLNPRKHVDNGYEIYFSIGQSF